MVEGTTDIIQLILAFITLILGGALIIFIYDAYRVVRQQSLLVFTGGLFLLILAIVLPDIIGALDAATVLSYWGSVISRIGEIIGIGIMIYAVLK
jgi:hypothetical protein